MTKYIVDRERNQTHVMTTSGVLVAYVYDSFESNKGMAELIVRLLNQQGVNILDQIRELIKEEKRSSKNESITDDCGAV